MVNYQLHKTATFPNMCGTVSKAISLGVGGSRTLQLSSQPKPTRTGHGKVLFLMLRLVHELVEAVDNGNVDEI
jgi:hypothetical protein